MSYYNGSGLGQTGCGDMPDVGEPMNIAPGARATSVSGVRMVPTVWAQRAANARGARTSVDGRAGPNTLAALMQAWRADGSRGPAPTIIDPGHVSVSTSLEGTFSLARRVADPSGSTCGACQWSACRATSATTGTASRTVDPATGNQIANREEEVTTGGGGEGVLPQTGLMRYGMWPWVVGAVALTGIGVYFASTPAPRPVAANRRRRSRRSRSF